MTCLGIGITVYLLLGAASAAVTGRFSLVPWLKQLLLAVDRGVNVLITPFNCGASADHTLSGRAWRAEVNGLLWGRLWRPVIDLLFRWEGPGHCKRVHEWESSR